MASENETVEKVLSEIYDAYETWKRSEVASLPTQYLKEWHDLIEAAAKRECEATSEKSSQVFIEAKIRAALEDAEKVLDDSSHSIYGIPPHMNDLLARIRAALSAPPRNCDVLSKEEALEVLDDRSFSKEDTIEWLYAEAKREAK